ncbi:hypothetical protein SLS64_006519 [Diaporthe eres]|uniref:Uncharacterized protein n=1 Tax=Diaporthe eres TaxID=83184 RepID=A0ABR1NV32_DIAER
MIARAGSPLFVLVFALLLTAALSSPFQPHLYPRLDHTPLGLPNLPPGLFITYTGVLTGSFQLDSSNFPFDAAQCAGGSGTYFFNDTANSTVRIGVNPPSLDPSPVFFMIQQGGPVLPQPDPGPETGSPTSIQAPAGPTSPTPTDTTSLTWTPSFDLSRPTVMPIPIFSAAPRAFHEASGGPDTRQAAADPVLPPGATRSGGVKNLLFASLYTICTQDSRPCGTIRKPDQDAPTYNALRMLDLASPTTSEADGGASYTLHGDQSTWAGNDTIEWSGLEFSPPANYTTTTNPSEPEACTAYRYPPLVWNATTPFTYDLVFSNASATLSLVLTAPLGTLRLRLDGSRAPDGPDGGAGAAVGAVQVGSGAGGAPRWSFVNGTGFHFDGVTPLANSSVADGGLFNGQNGLGSGAAGAWAGWSGGVVVAVAAGFAALLL